MCQFATGNGFCRSSVDWKLSYGKDFQPILAMSSLAELNDNNSEPMLA
jgi:hypothetical protein